MSERLVAKGGLCAPLADAYNLHETEIRPGYVAPRWRARTFRGRLRNFFAWDKDWGTHLWGGPPARLRDLLPVFTAPRGGISYLRVPESFDD